MIITETLKFSEDEVKDNWITQLQWNNLARQQKKNRVLAAGRKFRDSIPLEDRAEFAAMR